MPYYLHGSNDAPDTGTAYPSKDLALADRTDGQTVSFVPTEEERWHWRDREYARFQQLEYAKVPWSDEYWAYNIQTEHSHYVHMSVKHPGLVAYTPNDEFGVTDRQLRVKPGKYLSQFASHLSQSQIDYFVASVKAFDGTHFKIAESTEDIVAAYLSGDLGSCMAHDTEYYRSPVHPVSVYGESDLAVAYLGCIQTKCVTARAVIWPAKKVYARIYGDLVLRALLEKDGYRQSFDFSGAKIRAIRARGSFVMPYCDMADSASHDGQYMMLRDDDCGEYGCKTTSGIAEINEEPEDEVFYCNRDGCDRERDEDEIYCSRCQDDVQYCEHCEEDRFDHSFTEINDSWYCENCVPSSEDCEICDQTFYPDVEFNDREKRERERRNVSVLCADCADNHQYCESCDTYIDREDLTCPDCGTDAPTQRCRHTADLPLTDPDPVPIISMIDPRDGEIRTLHVEGLVLSSLSGRLGTVHVDPMAWHRDFAGSGWITDRLWPEWILRYGSSVPRVLVTIRSESHRDTRTLSSDGTVTSTAGGLSNGHTGQTEIDPRQWIQNHMTGVHSDYRIVSVDSSLDVSGLISQIPMTIAENSCSPF